MKILIVEDDVDLAETCQMVLETCHEDVQVAHSAEEALVKIAERKPDLVISDCVLPGRSGLELCQQLRSHYPRNTLPLMLMSGSLRSQVAHGDSYDAFLTKPFLAESLLAEVERLLHPSDIVPESIVRGAQ
ncbi:two-component system, OmpR family, phosphate regulon response regulator PhoB/two-component system, OmpR family, response regulator MprA [Duganella sacchari]|uniref:Two-component system, OmpR family, phosphate regulon response regulator PhoB/two-component system, OmpR family, response regulator MprA n=1 Tax=Duganella sacchari TaxID=551987 RepID=A0A1M7Q7K9_9BURK|nr:response regulator [Duganella sacchari]SHN26523.1 two-component system, OmpR family, phosphate regulon response regulator PhoB/two-component system, OmpR family, response regulator MprA [Duganella sacchari]